MSIARHVGPPVDDARLSLGSESDGLEALQKFGRDPAFEKPAMVNELVVEYLRAIRPAHDMIARSRSWDTTAIVEAEAISDEVAAAQLANWELQPSPEFAQPRRWYRGIVVVRQLVNMYGDIGSDHAAPIRASKGYRMGDIADSICANFKGWNDPLMRDLEMMAKLFSDRQKRILVYIGSDGRAYVGDGNKRALGACFHRELTLAALVCEVETFWPPEPITGTHPTWLT